MQSIINIYKPVSLTPFQAIQLFKKKYPRYRNSKISYAGRLDPMAEGILILLVNQENKKIKQYMNLDKVYKAKILFNFKTDSYDVLGIPKYNSSQLPEKKNVIKSINNFKGVYEQTLPAFSSYKVDGKPLFHHARKKTLPKELPKKTVRIKKVNLNSIYTVNSNRLLKQIVKKISGLEGDFRQREIIKKWTSLFSKKHGDRFMAAEVIFSVSSGTYIRSIANELGIKLGSSAVLLNLTRTKVGKFDIKDSLKLKKNN